MYVFNIKLLTICIDMFHSSQALPSLESDCLVTSTVM